MNNKNPKYAPSIGFWKSFPVKINDDILNLSAATMLHFRVIIFSRIEFLTSEQSVTFFKISFQNIIAEFRFSGNRFWLTSPEASYFALFFLNCFWWLSFENPLHYYGENELFSVELVRIHSISSECIKIWMRQCQQPIPPRPAMKFILHLVHHPSNSVRNTAHGKR
jgi:hypothetical protein